MKYIVIVSRKDGLGDMFSSEFNLYRDAVKEAEWQWGYLTANEKKTHKIEVIKSDDPDADSSNHYDGIVKKCFE